MDLIFTMQTIDICDPDLEHLYCPICGTHTLSPDAPQTAPCAHLVYVTCSDTPDDPWYLREGLKVELPEDCESIPQALAPRFPDNTYLLFLISSPAPAGLEVYVVYSYQPVTSPA